MAVIFFMVVFLASLGEMRVQSDALLNATANIVSSSPNSTSLSVWCRSPLTALKAWTMFNEPDRALKVARIVTAIASARCAVVGSGAIIVILMTQLIYYMSHYNPRNNE